MLQIVVWAGVLLRFLAAIWNGLYAPIAFTKIDALGFQFYASGYSKNLVLESSFGTEGAVYVKALGFIYYLMTDSFFLGCVFSILAWLISALILIRAMRLLEINRRCQIQAMVIFSCLPASIFFTSTTLREAFELMLVNLMLYSALKIYLQKSIVYYFILPIVVAGLGYFHSALLAVGLIFISSLTVLVVFYRRKQLTFIQILLLAPLTISPVIGLLSLIPRFHYQFKENLLLVYNEYLYGVVNQAGRTVYRELTVYTEIWEIVLDIPFILFQYLFEPMPWNVSSYGDLGLLFEAIIRAWLIFKAITGIKKLPLPQLNAVMLTFVLYFILEGIWSLGTANWGTAARHHVPSTGLLVVAALANESFLKFPINTYRRYRYS